MEAGKKRDIPKKLLLCLLFGGVLVMCLETGLSILRPGAPCSLARHAALWAGCFGILAAGTLLVCYWTPAGKAWTWLNEKLMNPETRKPWIDIALTIAAGAMLLHHFYVIMYFPVVPSGASKLAPVWIVLAAVTAVLGRSWRDRGTRLGTLLLVFLFERTFLKQRLLTGNEMVYFASGLYAVFICYGVLSALRPRFRKKFLQVVCALWSMGTLVLCGILLYTAWTGVWVYNFAKHFTQVSGGRLQLFGNAATSAGWMAACFAVALMGLLLSKHRAVRIGYLLTAFLAALTVSLTDSRASFMMVAFLLAGMVCLLAWSAWGRKTVRPSKGKTALMALALLLCFALCFVAAVGAERQLTNLYMKVRTQSGRIIPSAQAETAEPDPEDTPEVTSPPPSFIQRDTWLSGDADVNRVLDGRWAVWKNTLNYLRQHPKTLLYGLSADGSVSAAVGREDHLHNVLLQLLMEGGLPALLLFLGLLLYFFIHACRLWTRWKLPLWQRMLPVAALSVLVLDMAECLTHFSFGHPPMTLLWLFMGCTVAVSRQIAAEETGKQPAAGCREA